MAQEFVSNPADFACSDSGDANPGQERLRLMVIGPPGWVRETIHDFHSRGIANASSWSSLLPGPNPGEVMSILTRRRQAS